MICCGSCSGSGSSTDSGSRLIENSFPKTKYLYKTLPFDGQKQHFSPESWPPFFDFFILFLLNFILDPDPNPVPLRQKIYGSSGSGSTTLLRALVATSKLYNQYIHFKEGL
jgi:hypothetical protein